MVRRPAGKAKLDSRNANGGNPKLGNFATVNLGLQTFGFCSQSVKGVTQWREWFA
jgi:hypothetical protein